LDQDSRPEPVTSAKPPRNDAHATTYDDVRKEGPTEIIFEVLLLAGAGLLTLAGLFARLG
jgi:hypothetical protein